jgi:hypothetical protein
MAVMVPGPLLRAVRAAVFAAACVTLSVTGHAWMSGHAVAPWAVLTACAGVFACAYAVGGRRRGYPAIATLMLSGEAVMHELFMRAQGAPSSNAGLAFVHRIGGIVTSLVHSPQPASSAWSAMPMPAGMTMPDMPGMTSGMSGDAATAAGGMGHGTLGMIAAHVAAGLLCSWWLARGEARVFGLLSALVLALFAPMRLAVAVLGGRFLPPRRAVAADAPMRVQYSALLTYAMVRRGPPPRGMGLI